MTRVLPLACAFLLTCLLRPAYADERDAAALASGEFFSVLLGAGLVRPLAEGDESTALRTADTLVVTYLTTNALKSLFGAERPDGIKNDSFPSGHASLSFAVATMQAEANPDEAVLWYAGATAVAASRVKLKRHFVRDVIGGAALGYGLAQLELEADRGLLISPFVDPSCDGVGVSLTWNP
jgi:membrane-associated PAP2 superfamily phosphatase